MNILAYEYFCAGAPRQGTGSGLFGEGSAMLKSLAGNLLRSGHNVFVMLDSRLSAAEIKGEFKNYILNEKGKRGSLDEHIADIISQCKSRSIDAVFPIAPDIILFEITGKLRSAGIEVIAADERSILISADKFKFYENLKGTANVPGTYISKEFQPAGNKSFILKPRYGAGCENTFIFNCLEELSALEDYIGGNETDFIIQEMVTGDAASVTLLSDGKRAYPVALNSQEIEFSDNSHSIKYKGGSTPYEHPLKSEAFDAAKKAVESIGGFRGCLGVDVVLGEKVWIIEINPRFTTPMTVLDECTNFTFNIADAAIKAYFNEKFEYDVEFYKTVNFSL